MSKSSERALLARDARRDLSAELVDSLRELEAGKIGRITVIDAPNTLASIPLRTSASIKKSAR
ncbi:MAG: hypothetical protein SF172_09225 [Burkholderiales bacterium]|nr:hypothetical protein [Burkholderiales bacterium]